nr:hypothetical protein [Tanacetum cinerariifolium]
VKGIGRVSPMKSKPISQYNPVTVQVVKESDKVQQPKVKPAVDEKDNLMVKPAILKEKPAVVKEKPVVVKEKPAGVTSKVSKGKDDVVKAPAADKDAPCPMPQNVLLWNNINVMILEHTEYVST